MAVTVIEQYPTGTYIPAGMDMIFVASNSPTVANQTRVKFCVDVYISQNVPNPSNNSHYIGTFKTTPNNAGVGMFNLRNVVENYVKADNMAAANSQYKGTATTDETPHPLHLIDKYSMNDNLVRYMSCKFYVEYLDTDTGSTTYNQVVPDTDSEVNSDLFAILNAYLKYSDVLTSASGVNGFGYDFSRFVMDSDTDSFLTNAPTTQYANYDDYGTLALFPFQNVKRILLSYHDSSGSDLAQEIVTLNATNGAFTTYGNFSGKEILYFGCFPANLRNWSTVFNGITVAPYIVGGHIEVQAFNTTPSLTPVSEIVKIYVNCPDKLGYEPIRLCWLNQWGAWDYYTFTQKSTKTISTQGSTYTQLQGTWNESLYKVDGYKGGKKSFRVNATESITMNTDFVSESENVMFEELINSPEIYQLQGFQDDVDYSLLNQYVTPVRLKTSSFTRKTLGNDQLIQYTFEVEKTKTLRTQSI
jgi:hypothetical protein